MLPLDLSHLLGPLGESAVLVGIGFAFGYVLESAGFGDSRRLAGQFYFRDLAVLRVMFTAIVTAMLLVFWSAALGWLSYADIWVNPTFWWPGIAGGLLMGMGFILGGYCPGTSLVSLATFKLDGLFFVLGALAGVTLFGESADAIAAFADSGSAGRLTLPALAGVDAGWVALAVVLMALGMFRAATWVKGRVTGQAEPPTGWARLGAALLVLAALGLAWTGQPPWQEAWRRVPGAADKLAAREILVTPAEALQRLQDPATHLLVLDVRDEADYNLFHLRGATRLDEDLWDKLERDGTPAGSIVLLAGNGETRALEAWKRMQALRVPQAYVLEGGLNRWLEEFGDSLESRPVADEDGRAWVLPAALDERWPAAWPLLHGHVPEFTPRIQTGGAGRKAGGCG
jgi:hypothetical protein